MEVGRIELGRRSIGKRCAAMPSPLPKIYDGNRASMIKGYTMFATYVRLLREELAARGIALPQNNND